MAGIEFNVGQSVLGHIIGSNGDAKELFRGIVIGKTKSGRIRVKNSDNVIKNFNSDNLFHLNKDGNMGF